MFHCTLKSFPILHFAFNMTATWNRHYITATRLLSLCLKLLKSLNQYKYNYYKSAPGLNMVNDFFPPFFSLFSPCNGKCHMNKFSGPSPNLLVHARHEPATATNIWCPAKHCHKKIVQKETYNLTLKYRYGRLKRNINQCPVIRKRMHKVPWVKNSGNTSMFIRAAESYGLM